MRFDAYPSGNGVMHAHFEPGEAPAPLPCPFCGGSDVTIENTHTAAYWVECPCGAEVAGQSFPGRSRTAHRLALLSALGAWNRRSTPEDR